MTVVVAAKITAFVFGTGAIAWISRASLRNPRSHGFYRFFAWEMILALFLLNVNYWFVDPLQPWQLVSWLFLTLSLLLIIEGVRLFRQHGRLDLKRGDRTLVGIEKTTALVTTGLYHYIRHPFYSSLLFLGWGIQLKHLSWAGFLLAMINTILLVIIARIEEKENIVYFGEPYREYMRATKMFLPFIY